MKFRKKPVIIDATRFPVEVPDSLNADYNRAFVDLANWCGGACVDLTTVEGKFAPRIRIITLEGIMEAQPGDWIIKGVKGEFYPCKPDIFDATYDPVLPDETA